MCQEQTFALPTHNLGKIQDGRRSRKPGGQCQVVFGAPVNFSKSLEEALKLLFLLEPPPQQSCQKKYFREDSLGSVFLEQLRGPGPLTGGHLYPASLPHPRFSRAVWAEEFLNLPCDQRLFRELTWRWGAAHGSHLPQEPPSAG